MPVLNATAFRTPTFWWQKYQLRFNATAEENTTQFLPYPDIVAYPHMIAPTLVPARSQPVKTNYFENKIDLDQWFCLTQWK
jgi:hypothetical protein